MLRIICPNCDRAREVQDHALNKRVTCKGCGKPYIVTDEVIEEEWDEESQAPSRSDGEIQQNHPQLGKFIREYPNVISQNSKYFQFGCSIIMLGIAVLLLIVIKSPWPRWIIGGLVLLAGLYEAIGLIVDIVRNKSPLLIRVLLYQNGFIYERSGQTVCPWNAIAEISNIGYGWPKETPPPGPKVKLHNDKTVEIDDMIKDLQDFTEILIDKVSKVLGQQIEEKLERNGKVRFGKEVTLTTSGLKIDRDLCPWDSITAIQMRIALRRNEDYEPIYGGGALGYLINRWGMRERKVPILQIVRDRGSDVEIEQSEISNLPILLEILKTRFHVTVREKKKKRPAL